MKRRSAAGSLIAVGVALLATGCGSTSLSEKQLRSRATKLCATAAGRAGRIPTPSSAEDSLAFLTRGIDTLKPELAGLRELKAPDDLDDIYQTSLKAFGNKLDALEQTVHKLHSGEDPVVAWKTLQERLGPLESTEDGAWRALDIPACLNS